MITEIPLAQDFEKLGVECICKSLHMLFDISKEISRAADDVSDEHFPNDMWDYNHITMRTSLIILYQGVEYLMKSKVAEKSALLLIENKRTNWPSLDNISNKTFNELQTISGENLLPVFCAVLEASFDSKKFITNFQELRSIRNKMVHSISNSNLNKNYIIESILQFFDFFYGNLKWKNYLQEMFYKSPLFSVYDEDLEVASFYEVLNFIEKTIGKGKLNNYFSMDIKSRRYHCPSCSYAFYKHGDFDSVSKWAFLNPNDPNSTKLECVVCNKIHNIVRRDCSEDSCRGNVICEEFNSDNKCLTCLSEDN